MIKKIAFMLYFLITVVLMSATVVEKFEGTTYIQQSVYGAWWFYLLWGIMSLFAFVYIVRVKLYREFSTFLLHISFCIMLLGGIVTALTAEQGSLYLEFDRPVSTYTNDEGQPVSIPFTVVLNDLEIEYYSGTNAVADYISQVSFESPSGDVSSSIISMNNIAKHQGYRFYQSGYDNWGSQLIVSRDIYGIAITYAGYLLLGFSLLLLLITPRGALRRLLRSSILRKTASVLLLVVFVQSAYAVKSGEDFLPKSLTNAQLEKLDNIQVVYNDRVMPLTTLAHDFTLKLIGNSKYRGMTAEQFFWGWLLYPTQWEHQAIFEVPLSPKQEFLELRGRSSYLDFFTDKKVYKLNHYIRNTEQKTQPALFKELNKLNEKVQLVAMLRSGAMLKIFPYRDSTNNITWYSPVDELPSEMEQGQALFIKNSVDMLLKASLSANAGDFELIASKIIGYQLKYGEESLIPHQKLRAEQFYYSVPITTILYRINLLVGILGVIALVLYSKRARLERTVVSLLKLSIIVAVCSLSIHIGLKWFITGRMPLVNGYDTMIFLGWSVSVITLFVSRNSSFFTAMGTLLVGFAMLVATIGGMNPQITPLIPVLNSPFLTTHVCFIMLSYALFAFTLVNGVLALSIARKDSILMKRLTLYSRIFLILGISFLAIGIFIGAVWANVSWGRYWAWDPKEVWALITMMLYALPLHSRSLSFMRNNRVFHIYLIIVFLSVVMTYFGVNYILGGIHSYVS